MMRFKHLLAMAGTVAGTATLLLAFGAPAGAQPMDVVVPHIFQQAPTTADCQMALAINCYSPNQLEQAYGMNSLFNEGLNGSGRTIVIVDSFGSPTIQNDLASFDQEFGIAAPPSLDVIQPDGPVPTFDPTDSTMVNWAVETSLDVEYSHAMAPGANILLVETPVAETEGTTGFPEIVAAENYVINHNLGDVISQSFGASEPTFPSRLSIFGLRSAYINAALHNVTVLGSSGDAGPTDETTDGTDFFPFRINSWPSSDPLVTSVGGTMLSLDANGNRLAPDVVWNDTFNQNVTGPTPSPAAGGGGLSAVFSRPSYQNSVAGVVRGSRGTPDVSLSAAVNGGALVFVSFGPFAPGGFLIVGGTSEASPLFSGIVAVADQAAGHRLGQLNPTLYGLGDNRNSGIVDVSGGNNTVAFTNTTQFPGTFTVQGFSASHGYDLATGLGTPDGPRLVQELAGGRGRGPGW
jgi:subtilase family serine protease